jgi:hypothetical protein
MAFTSPPVLAKASAADNYGGRPYPLATLLAAKAT